MYVKIKNGVVERYPYSVGNLKAENPNTSFPASIPDSLLEEFNVFPVNPTERPQVDHTKNVVEETPNFIGGKWYQDFKVVDATVEEIAERILDMTQKAEAKRVAAYRNESDPLFFKWQRGEVTQQEWLDKIAEIKARYPDPVG